MPDSPHRGSQPNRGLTGLRSRGQTTGDQLIGVMLVIVIAAAIGFIGTDVSGELDSNLDVPLNGENITVTNESTGTVVFTGGNDFYTVNDANRGATFFDDEQVFNTTSDTQLTEGTDYTWTTSNATLKLINTSAIGNNSADIVITYNYTEKNNNFAEANNNISTGFTDAMSLTDVVFIVLMFSVILAALMAFRRRS